MYAKGLSEYANQSLNYAQWGLPLYPEPFYLSWDQRHTFKANADLTLPDDISANFLFQYNTPRPYSYYPTKDGFYATDAAKAFIPNNARMTEYLNLDFKASKKIVINEIRNINMFIYVDVRNVLNSKNVKWVDSNGRVGGELADPGAYSNPRRTRVGARIEF
jgi:hypothetical protein